MRYYELRFFRDSNVVDRDVPCYVFWVYAGSIYDAVVMAYDRLSQEVGLTHDFDFSVKEVFFDEDSRKTRQRSSRFSCNCWSHSFH